MGAKKLDWAYAPQEGSQQRLWDAMHPDSPYSHIGFGGSRGGGKSFGARGVLWELCMVMPLHVCIVRKTKTDCETNHIEPMKTELRGYIDSKVILYNGRDFSFKFHNGAKFDFRYCSKDSDLDHWQGQSYDVIVFEEATQFTEHQIRFIRTTVRTSAIAQSYKTKYNPRCLYTFNWGGPAHSYMKRIFWDGAVKKQYDLYQRGEFPHEHTFIFSSVFDNPILLKTSPGYVRELLALKGALRRAHLIGDPEAFQGSFIQMFERAHTVEPFLIPETWNIFGALDPGTGSPCSFGIYARPPAPESRLIKIAHYYEEGRKVETHAKEIAAFIEGCKWIPKKPAYIVAGRDAFARQSKFQIQAHDFTWQDVFHEYGMTLLPANTQRPQTDTGLLTALDFEYDYSEDKLIRAPKLQFFSGQDATFERMNALERDPKKPEQPLQPEGIEDHDYDETKYAVASAIRPMMAHSEMSSEMNETKDYGRELQEAHAEGDFGGAEPDWREYM